MWTIRDHKAITKITPPLAIVINITDNLKIHKILTNLSQSQTEKEAQQLQKVYCVRKRDLREHIVATSSDEYPEILIKVYSKTT